MRPRRTQFTFPGATQRPGTRLRRIGLIACPRTASGRRCKADEDQRNDHHQRHIPDALHHAAPMRKRLISFARRYPPPELFVNELRRRPSHLSRRLQVIDESCRPQHSSVRRATKAALSAGRGRPRPRTRCDAPISGAQAPPPRGTRPAGGAPGSAATTPRTGWGR